MLRRACAAPVVRRGALLCAVLVGFAGMAAAAWGSGDAAAAHKASSSKGPARAGRSAGRSSSPSRGLAESDAETLLRRVPLPPGSQRVAVPPKHAGLPVGNRNTGHLRLVDRHAFWKAPVSMAAATGWVAAHMPATWKVSGRGYGSKHGVLESRSLRIGVPGKGRLRLRTIVIEAVPVSGGALLRVDAEVAWVPARKQSSLVPGAGELSMKVATGRGRHGRLPGRTTGRPVVLTKHREVGTMRSAINHLSTTTGLPISCPEVPTPALYLWITFRADRSASPLARVRVDLGGCGEGADVALTVHGHRTPALTGSEKLISEIKCDLQVRIGRDGISREAHAPSARTAARALLCRLKLPAGARRMQGDQSRSGRLAHPLASPSNSSKLVDVHRFWRVPGRPCKVMGWIEQHPPAGAGVTLSAGGSRSNEPCRPASLAEREAQVPPSSNEPLPPALPTLWGVRYSFPEPRRFSRRALELQLAAAQGGGTAIRADALVAKHVGAGTRAVKHHRRPPLNVVKVPQRLPARGVYVDHQFILHPAVPHAHALSKSAAIAFAHHYVTHPYPVRALFATLTVPGTIPQPDSRLPYDEVAGKHAWIVIFTAPHPFNASEGGPAGSHSYVEAQHLVVALDARTGAFLRGFETK